MSFWQGCLTRLKCNHIQVKTSLQRFARGIFWDLNKVFNCLRVQGHLARNRELSQRYHERKIYHGRWGLIIQMQLSYDRHVSVVFM